MRDHQKAQIDRSKYGRRQLLVALLLAGSPCLAQQPQSNGFGVLPPLPLNAATVSPQVRTNPYCASESDAQKPAVRLTTGASQATRSVHLSPIGAAIGLNPIGADQKPPGPAGRGPILTIEPARESAVQINPLLQSTHHRNHELVEAKLAPARPVSHAVPQDPTGNATPIRKTREASILLVNPAPKPLLVVKPQRPTVAVPQTTVKSLTEPATSVKPLVVVAQPLPAEPEKQSKPPATVAKTSPKSSKPLASSPKIKTKPEPKTKPAPAVKPTQIAAPKKRSQGASIASMLSQTPRDTSNETKDEEAAPIFFSLSDVAEVAPTEKTLANGEPNKLTKLPTIKPQPEQHSLPAPVTVREDGSVVTSARPKPKRAPNRKSTIAQPILANQSGLGAGLSLPTPASSPKEVSVPTRMPKLPATAKRITPNDKSSAGSHEKLSIAAVEQFQPRIGAENVKSISPAKPFSVFGEKAKPMVQAKDSEGASSILAQSRAATKQAPKMDSGSSKLTLPTPINIPGKIATTSPNGEAGRSIIKVERPSPEEHARNNPHAEFAKSEGKTELVNPFNRQRKNSTAAIKEPAAPKTKAMNQAVRVEKYKISKDRPRVNVALESERTTEQTTNQSPIARGVVAPITLPNSEFKENTAGNIAKAEPVAKAKPPVAATDPNPAPKVTSVANNQVQTKAAIADTPTSESEVPSGTSILRKRYRPPVAVQAIPGTVQRQPPAASTKSAKVQSVPEMILSNKKAQPLTVDLQQAMRLDTASQLKDRDLVLSPDIKLTPLHMNQAQVRSLTLGGSVRGVRVGDKGVCQAFASGPNQLKLIGTGIGTTQLVVWAQTGGENDEVLMRAFEIHVNEVVPSEGNSIENTTNLLNQSIQKVFPHSQAKVQLVRGELWVTGVCESPDSAEKIIRMVRKSCLIPVKDQLTIK